MAKAATANVKKSPQAQPRYKSLHLRRQVKHAGRLPNVWRLTVATAQLCWQHKRLLAGITLVYGLLSILLTQTLIGTTDVTGIKAELSSIFSGQWGSLASSLGIFAVLVGSNGGGVDDAGAAVYRLILGLIVSLAVIWSLRQVMAGKRISVKDAYYKGMYPLVPFSLVLIVVGLQLIPLFIGSALYEAVVSNGLALLAVEQLLWGLLYGSLALLSLYMLSSSLFGLYIVTLPNMTPLKALRSARELVRFRRWTVLRKILFLPLLLLGVAAVIMLPVIMWLTPLTQAIFFLLTMFGMVAAHSYMYVLYRELLNE